MPSYLQKEFEPGRGIFDSNPISSSPMPDKLNELAIAFDICNSTDEPCTTYISKLDGSLVYDAEGISGVPCPVEDIEDNVDYVALPDKFELNLGTALVWRFVAREIPGLEPKVRDIFSRSGAYRRWKHFLNDLDLLEKWFQFEETSTREALLQWCKANEIPIED